jgi:hypothetical protein
VAYALFGEDFEIDCLFHLHRILVDNKGLRSKPATNWLSHSHLWQHARIEKFPQIEKNSTIVFTADRLAVFTRLTIQDSPSRGPRHHRHRPRRAP